MCDTAASRTERTHTSHLISHDHTDSAATQRLVGVVDRDGPRGSDIHGLLARRHHDGGGRHRVSRRNHAIVVTVYLEESDLLAQQTCAAAHPEHEAGHEAPDLVIDLVLSSESLAILCVHAGSAARQQARHNEAAAEVATASGLGHIAGCAWTTKGHVAAGVAPIWPTAWIDDPRSPGAAHRHHGRGHEHRAARSGIRIRDNGAHRPAIRVHSHGLSNGDLRVEAHLGSARAVR